MVPNSGFATTFMLVAAAAGVSLAILGGIFGSMHLAFLLLTWYFGSL